MDKIAEGSKVRRQVLGADYVDSTKSAGSADPFYQHFIEFTNEHCWGNVWLRPGLDYKTRSMLNLAMLSAMARWHEVAVHVRGAINNGVTEDEIAEILLQAGVYAGVPIASEGFKVAREVIQTMRKERAAKS